MGSFEEWEEATKYLKLPFDLEGPCLCVDSLAIRKFGKARSSDWDWSKKLRALAKHFMVLWDGGGRIQKIWGGFSPKLLDEQIVELQRDWWMEQCKGAVVVGDSKFSEAREYVDSRATTFHVPYAEPRRNKAGQICGKGAVPPTKEQKKYNAAVAELKGCVENVGETMKRKFHALQRPWRESDKQLDHLMYIAAGVCNDEAT